MPRDQGMGDGRDRAESERDAREPMRADREQSEQRDTEDRPTDDGRERREQQGRVSGDDVMHGRDFAGSNIFATEREQTLDAERVVEHREAADEFVTEAELEAREGRTEGNED